jgi:hypothetical protein
MKILGNLPKLNSLGQSLAIKAWEQPLIAGTREVLGKEVSDVRSCSPRSNGLSMANWR